MKEIEKKNVNFYIFNIELFYYLFDYIFIILHKGIFPNTLRRILS